MPGHPDLQAAMGSQDDGEDMANHTPKPWTEVPLTGRLVLADGAVIAGQGLGADEQLDLRRGAALLDRALAMLDEADRAVYVLVELEQLSRSEVSQVLAIPQGTVATRLKRARDACLAAVRRVHRGGSP